MNRRLSRRALGLATALAIALPAAAPHAQTLIRDAETEHISREWAKPLFAAAGLDPEVVRIHLVLDSGINAFVAGGQRVFLYTGLLLAAETPLQLLGVIAHETAHIAAGHLIRTQEALRDANAQAIAGFLLGAAAAVGGAPDVGAAAILGGKQAAQRSFLRYSRAQELAADLAATRLMRRAGYAPVGLLEFMEVMAGGARLEIRADPYLRTHPVFPERIAALRAAVESAGPADTSTPVGGAETWARLQAKLFGYVEPIERVLRRYPPTDSDVPARVARAVAYDRAGRLDDALAEIDALQSELPDDPYIWELHGQVLLQHGRVGESIPSYRRAADLLPQEPQFRVGLAAAQIAAEDPTLLAEAIGHLTAAVSEDRQYATAWRQLAIAHGRSGDLGHSALASAEQYLLAGDLRRAQGFVEQALRLLPRGSPGWLRAQDMKNTAEDRR